MSASTATEQAIPDNIGRNDPCPCGSGQKYKKCCYRVHQVQREASKQTRNVEDLIGPSTIPLKVYQILEQANEANLGAFVYDMFHELGPQRERYAAATDYLLALDKGQDELPASGRFAFARMRVDSPDVFLLLTAGADDPKVDYVEYDIVTLRPNEVDATGQEREVRHPGWRIWAIRRVRRAKSELTDTDLSLGELGVAWHPWERPVKAVEEAPTA